ncbi:hypothetical protein FF38_02391 [Lucilia cuprina]|uniref:Uncharacterized protein n=1 Tax=Lucilia cuprina TaxID=7375 RepID=A0A0L0CAK6_LUCCU|nr:hypothetical protein FF38_02391 [Lucilia cuprina]
MFLHNNGEKANIASGSSGYSVQVSNIIELCFGYKILNRIVVFAYMHYYMVYNSGEVNFEDFLYFLKKDCVFVFHYTIKQITIVAFAVQSYVYGVYVEYMGLPPTTFNFVVTFVLFRWPKKILLPKLMFGENVSLFLNLNLTRVPNCCFMCGQIQFRMHDFHGRVEISITTKCTSAVQNILKQNLIPSSAYMQLKPLM